MPDKAILSPSAMQSREALRGQMDAVLDSVPDAMIVIDQTGRILEFSRAAQEMFGYALEDIIGENVSKLMTRTDSSAHDGYINNFIKTGNARIIGIGRTVMAKRADGDHFPVDLKIGKAKIGQTHVFTGFIRDLTEQQQAELRMQEMQAELVHFSRLSAVGTMASAMAHELNQPLTAVANYLEAGRDLLDDPNAETLAMVQEALDEAAKQSVRAGQIVRKLRDYVSRGEITARPIEVKPMIMDAISLARIGAESDVISVTPHIDPSVGMVKADPVQIQQVVINLVRNAYEALERHESPEIWIEARSASREMVSFTVADNGPGFADDVAANLFRPFTTSKTTGMGLGLSICQMIIEAHGGQITAGESERGGAAFTFTLPKHNGDDPS